jgi:hypothetical protein
MSDLYYKKYLKYRSKYLTLKNQVGGNIDNLVIEMAKAQNLIQLGSLLSLKESIATMKAFANNTKLLSEYQIKEGIENMGRNIKNLDTLLRDPGLEMDDKKHFRMCYLPKMYTEHLECLLQTVGKIMNYHKPGKPAEKQLKMSKDPVKFFEFLKASSFNVITPTNTADKIIDVKSHVYRCAANVITELGGTV